MSSINNKPKYQRGFYATLSPSGQKLIDPFSQRLQDTTQSNTPTIEPLTVSTGSSIDFTVFSPGIGPDLAQYGYGFERLDAETIGYPQTINTVQIGLSSVLVDGLTQNVPRIGNNGEGCFGLVLEEARTNYMWGARNPATAGVLHYDNDWYVYDHGGVQTGYTASVGYTGPDGQDLAVRFSCKDVGDASKWAEANVGESLNGVGTNCMVASIWAKHPGAGSSGRFEASAVPYVYNDTYTVLSDITSSNSSSFVYGVAGSDWKRYVGNQAKVGLNPNTGQPPWAHIHTLHSVPPVNAGLPDTYSWGTDGERDAIVDMFQVENGLFPTEFIQYNSGTVDYMSPTFSRGYRLNEFLYLLDGSDQITSGTLAVEMQFQPKGNLAQYDVGETYSSSPKSTQKRFLFGHQNISVSIDTREKRFVFEQVGSTLTTDPVDIDWNAGDTVRLFVKAGGGVSQSQVQIKVNDGSTTTAITTTGSYYGNLFPYSNNAGVYSFSEDTSVLYHTGCFYYGQQNGYYLNNASVYATVINDYGYGTFGETQHLVSASIGSLTVGQSYTVVVDSNANQSATGTPHFLMVKVDDGAVSRYAFFDLWNQTLVSASDCTASASWIGSTYGGLWGPEDPNEYWGEYSLTFTTTSTSASISFATARNSGDLAGTVYEATTGRYLPLVNVRLIQDGWSRSRYVPTYDNNPMSNGICPTPTGSIPLPDTLSLSGSCYILCNKDVSDTEMQFSDTTQLTSWINKITFYTSGSKPSWTV